ncbi:MAG TPA: mevalonate kinase [Gammaproteobacteria bacterium]|jgi:mevalonate kinase|nr:mevalonate kinase [Gammaproteobacteria bacterium]
MQLKASAPGSLMLLGEYAVLAGKPALVCAIDKRITVILTPRQDEQIHIDSALGHYTTSLSNLTIEKPFQFVLGTLQHCRPKLKYGCDLEIISEFSEQLGLGSSAAVTVATLIALTTWLNIRILPLDLIRQGRQIIRQIQGTGSGADVAAAVMGGTVGYQPHPISAERFTTIYPLTAVYAGFKIPTTEAIQRVHDAFTTMPSLLRHLQNSIGQCAQEGIQWIRQNNWEKLGNLMNIQQGLMEALGTSTPLLRHLLEALRIHPDIIGAKISGAGFGDCVIGLGSATGYTHRNRQDGVLLVPVAITLQGAQCEKI